MKIVDNLYKNKLTYFVGKLIINGCQSFRIEDIDKIRTEFVFDVEEVKHIYYNEHDANEDLKLLINDEDWKVRVAVAEQGYGLDVLINDEDWWVRVAVAEQGYGLDILINDEDWKVRVAVARQGYGLDILINDEEYYIRKVVNEYLDNKK